MLFFGSLGDLGWGEVEWSACENRLETRNPDRLGEVAHVYQTQQFVGDAEVHTYSLGYQSIRRQPYILICKSSAGNGTVSRMALSEGYSVCHSSYQDSWLMVNVMPTWLRPWHPECC